MNDQRKGKTYNRKLILASEHSKICNVVFAQWIFQIINMAVWMTTSFWRTLMSIIITSLVMNTPCLTKTTLSAPLLLPQTKAFVTYFRSERLWSLSRFGRTYMMWCYPDVIIIAIFGFYFMSFCLKDDHPDAWACLVFGNVPAQSFPYGIHFLKWCII